jgi:hypothetical protein
MYAKTVLIIMCVVADGFGLPWCCAENETCIAHYTDQIKKGQAETKENQRKKIQV